MDTARPPVDEDQTVAGDGGHELDRQFAVTLARGMDVLRAFTADAPVLGNKEISIRTGLPKATVSRLTYTLTNLGYLQFLPHAGKYGKYELGRAVISMSYPLLANMELRQAARIPMRGLADHASGSVSLGVRDRLDMVYVHTAKPCESAGWVSDIGKTFPLCRSAMGGAFLSALRPAARDGLISQMKAMTPALWEANQRHVELFTQQNECYGFCMNDGLFDPRIHAVAAAMPMPDDADPFVFNCAIPAAMVTPGLLREDIGPRLVEMVKDVARRLAALERGGETA